MGAGFAEGRDLGFGVAPAEHGDGARMALLNVEKRKEADEFARKVEYIELTVSPEFEKTFAKSMWIPHMKDEFPHLSHLLPEKK